MFLIMCIQVYPIPSHPPHIYCVYITVMQQHAYHDYLPLYTCTCPEAVEVSSYPAGNLAAEVLLLFMLSVLDANRIFFGKQPKHV